MTENLAVDLKLRFVCSDKCKMPSFGVEPILEQLITEVLVNPYSTTNKIFLKFLQRPLIVDQLLYIVSF